MFFRQKSATLSLIEKAMATAANGAVFRIGSTSESERYRVAS